jgi:hypothetical protein
MGTTSKIVKYLPFVHELAFSLYFSGLLIWVNDAGSRWVNNPGDRVPWVLQLEQLIAGGYRVHSSVDDPMLRAAFGFLWVGSGVSIFLLLRILSRFSFTRVLLGNFAGIVAVAGFPLACVFVCPDLYAYHGVSLTLVEVAAALVCAYLYAHRNWPSMPLWGTLPLFFHFSFWSWCAWTVRYFPSLAGGVPLLWPGYNLSWLTTQAPQLIYPWFGLLATLAWAWYAREVVRMAAPSNGSRVP